MPSTQELHEMHLDMEEGRLDRVRLGAILIGDMELALLLLYSAGYKSGEGCAITDCQRCVVLGTVWWDLFRALQADYRTSVIETLRRLEIALPRRAC